MSSYAFKSVGSDVTIYPQAKIVGAENIEIGSHVIIDDFAFIVATGPTFIGNYVHIASFVSITGGGECWIEDFAGIAAGARLVTGSDDFLGKGLTNPTVPGEFRAVSRSFVNVGAHVLIGTNSVVLPGVSIGEGAAIGACSLVRKNIEPWSVYAGVPAKRMLARRSDIILRYEQELYARYGRPARLFRRSAPVATEAQA